MKFKNTRDNDIVEIVGVISYDTWFGGPNLVVVSESGKISTVYAKYLHPILETVPNMAITVGHVIDNTSFDFGGSFEITTTDDDGTVRVLYDSCDDMDKDVPAELLVEPITYMTPSHKHGYLRLEVRQDA